MPRKKTFHHGDLHRQCIETALQIIATKGIENLSLREVARRLKVSHGAPYKHFDNKEALVAAICERGFEIFGDYLKQARAKSTGDPYKDFRGMGRAYRKDALENPY